MDEKKCYKCKNKKNIIDFYKSNYSPDGYAYLCKRCHCSMTREYRIKNKEKVKKIQGDNYQKNKKERIIKQRIWAKNNKEKITIAKKNRLQKDPEYNRKISIRSHGITIEYFDMMFKEQKQSCWICSKEFKNKSDAKIDHNHETNIVRGLLCNNCNTSIGLVQENIDVLKKMIKYLKQNKDGWKKF